MKIYSLTTLIVVLFLSDPPTIFSQESPFSLKDKLYKQTSIAFASRRDGNFEIYLMNSDGSKPKNLTNNPAKDEYPSWSPDGKRIAFGSNRDGNSEVYIMNADGSNQTRLTDNPAFDHFPSWSPDGKKIVFASERDGDGNMNIYIMNADGSNQTRLTDNPAHDVKPQWSPDGKKIAFQTTRNGKEDVYVMNSDGSNQTRLTDSPAWDGCLSWSPDGKKIAFGSNRDGNYEIYVMNADGSEQTNLTNNPSTEQAPFWSPDGKKIAFYSLRKDVLDEKDYGKDGRGRSEYNSEIYVMNADGSDLINLTNHPAYDGYPNWSPFLKAQTGSSIHDLIQLQADKIFDSLVNIRRDIHENPELSFNEIRTSKLVAEYLSSLGLEVKTNIGGYGVVGILQCKNKGKIIGWRAEMDAWKTDLPDVVDFRSKVDSIRHICGHDVHTTIGLGIANVLSKLKDSVSGTVVFIFQPAEEYCEGAKHMIDDGLYDIIKPDEIYCLHLDDIPAGTVAIKSNAFFAYLKPLNITYKNIGNKDSLISFTKSVLNKYSTLDCIWDKSLDHKIGIFSGNSIFKDFVSFCGEIFLQENGQVKTLRTYYYGTDKKQLDSLPEKLTDVINQSAYANHFESITSLEFPGIEIYNINNDPELAEKARNTISTIYGENSIKEMDGVVMGFGDDFAYFQKDIPGGYYMLGGSNYEKGIISHPHTPDFAVDEKCIAAGVKYFSSMIVERLKDK